MIGRTAANGVVLLLALALAPGAAVRCARAEPADGGIEPRAVRVEARFVDHASGREASWGATGQILILAEPADPALARWPERRAVASSPSGQTVTLEAGARGVIRVGREIPFAGWFLRHGTRCGRVEEKTEWREVESALEIAVVPAADGVLHLSLTPEFGYLHGRARRTASFPAERVDVFLAPGVEAALAAPPALEAFYRRLLAGYDPVRRVWPVDLVLRADFVETAGNAGVPAHPGP